LQRHPVNEIAGGFHRVIQTGDAQDIELGQAIGGTAINGQDLLSIAQCNPSVSPSEYRSSKVNNFQMRFHMNVIKALIPFAKVLDIIAQM
jgi:hypothetical protein